MIRFKGRGFTSTVVRITVDPEGATFRADCDDHPESWCELVVPLAELVRLAELVKLRQCEHESDLKLISRDGVVLDSVPAPK